MADASKNIKRYLENFRDERNSAALYRALAGFEKESKLAEVYRRLAETEEKHAEAWAERLRDAGAGARGVGQASRNAAHEQSRERPRYPCPRRTGREP